MKLQKGMYEMKEKKRVHVYDLKKNSNQTLNENEGKEKRWSQENDMEDSSTLAEMGSATFFDFDTRPFQQVSAQVKRNYLQ